MGKGGQAVTCPICNQKIDPSDHSEKWGPEFAHSRCVIAFTAGSAIQNAKLQDRIKRLEEAGNGLLWYFCPKNTGDISFLQSEAIKQWNKAKEAKL
jgi:hypothetical protein